MASIADVAPVRPPLWQFIKEELKPKGPLLTLFNLWAAVIVLGGIVILTIRFWKGLAAVTNLSQDYPWGLWIGLDVVTGVAFAGGAYVITFAVYVMRAERFHSIVRATVLNGFLSYLFYAGALVFDLGRPWHIVNPIIGNKFGFNSVLFIVAWHFLLYMTSELLEFSPAIAEWLNLKKARKFLSGMTAGVVIFGFAVSTLHQSGLGALFLFSKPKLHPLWFTEFLPILFFVSSIFAGISMIIFEGSLSHRFFGDQIDPARHASFDEIVVSLAKGAAVTMYLYLFLKVAVIVHQEQWHLLSTRWGAWFLVEVLLFTLVPCALFTHGYRERRIGVIKVAAVMTLLGVMLNRLNVSIIAFNWNKPVHYVPTIWEIWITAMVVTIEIVTFRWIVNRMPVLRESKPDNGE